MTHAPGAVVPKREVPAQEDDILGGKVDLGKKERSDEDLEEQPRKPMGRRTTAKTVTPARDDDDDDDVMKSLAGASKHIRSAGPSTPAVVTATPVAAPVEPTVQLPAQPSFIPQLFAALTTPLRGFPVTIVHAFILGIALMLLELSPLIGLIACVLAGGEMLALRVRLIRDSCAGRTAVAWPEFSEAFSAAPSYLIALALFLPAAGAGVAAWGPGATDSDSSVSARAQRLVKPVAEGTETGMGHNALVLLDLLISPELKGNDRGGDVLTRDLKESIDLQGKTLVDLDHASGAGTGARILLVVGFVLFPMAFLCAVRLKMLAAAIHIPLLLKSILRVPGAYLLVLVGFALHAVVILGAVCSLPFLRDEMGGTPGHLAWVLLTATLVTGSLMITGSLLGRLYQARQLVLAWD